MRGLPIIILLLIPALIALGHDGYLFYQNHVEPTGNFSFDLLMDKFKFSALGFIWTTYDEESYKLAFESLSTQDWQAIDSFLTYKAFYVGLAFAAIFLIPLFIIGFLGKGPFAMEGRVIHGSSKKGNPLKGRDQAKKYDYKRK